MLHLTHKQSAVKSKKERLKKQRQQQRQLCLVSDHDYDCVIDISFISIFDSVSGSGSFSIS